MHETIDTALAHGAAKQHPTIGIIGGGQLARMTAMAALGIGCDTVVLERHSFGPGRRPADIREFANIQIEVVVPPDVAGRLLARLETEFFPRFAMIAFEADIRVMRRDKF